MPRMSGYVSYFQQASPDNTQRTYIEKITNSNASMTSDEMLGEGRMKTTHD